MDAKNNSFFQNAVNNAGRVMQDKSRTDRLLEEAMLQAKKRSTDSGFFSDLKTLSRMVKSWNNGEFRKVPMQTIATIIGAITYVASPIDLIPDFIPFVGLVDDACVVALVVGALKKDIRKFLDWEECRRELLRQKFEKAKTAVVKGSKLQILGAAVTIGISVLIILTLTLVVTL